jgi:Hemerythrin HHE cation binding domain
MGGRAGEPGSDPGASPGGDSHNAIGVLAAEHAELQTLFRRVSSPEEDRPAVLKQLVMSLSAHVTMEKQLLVPAVKRLEDSGAADRLSTYHDEVERILVLVDRRKANSPDLPDLVTQLLDLTEAHVAYAANTLAPALRAVLTGHELTDLGAAMQSDERQLLTHPHPHLPDRGPVAAATRWAASVVDRQRDRSTDVNRSST